MIFPVMEGRGKRLFVGGSARAGLKHLPSYTTRTGTLVLRYALANAWP